MQIVPLIPIAAVLAWILYRRVRQHTGKQAVRPISMVIQMILLCAVAIIVIAGGVTNANLEGATIGAVIGCALALYALHLTRIERAAEGLFHSGNAYRPWRFDAFGRSNRLPRCRDGRHNAERACWNGFIDAARRPADRLLQQPIHNGTVFRGSGLLPYLLYGFAT